MTRSYYGDMTPVPEKNKKLGDYLVQESIKHTIEKELKQFHDDLQEVLFKAKEDSEKMARKLRGEMKTLSNKVYLVEEKLKAFIKNNKPTKKEMDEQQEKDEVRRRLRARGVNVV
jgi:ElaB/YqjD/DUF883 family membrane-anchored ribosome-binding protein